MYTTHIYICNGVIYVAHASRELAITAGMFKVRKYIVVKLAPFQTLWSDSTATEGCDGARGSPGGFRITELSCQPDDY